MIYPWQQAAWQQLLKAQAQGRLGHALLLTGPKGLGKYDLAKTLAQFILCEAPTTEPCGECRACRLFTQGTHPDYFSVLCDEKNKNIKVDQIRTLCAALTQTAQLGTLQVVTLYPADNMNKAAANALLKTLEEPPGQVLLILISHRPALLAKTIVSRCQRVSLKQTYAKETHAWLQEKLTQPLDANLLLKLAEGAPLRAVLLEQNNYVVLRDGLLEHLQTLSQPAGQPLAFNQALLKEDLLLVLLALFTIANDIARLCLGIAPQYLINQDRLALLQTLTSTFNYVTLNHVLIKLQQAQRLLVTGMNVNGQLLLENIFITWKNKC